MSKSAFRIIAATALLTVAGSIRAQSDLIVQIAPNASPDAVAALRAAADAQGVTRISSIDSEIWRVPTDRTPEILVRAMGTPGITAADYAGADYRSLFLGVPQDVPLSSSQRAPFHALAAGGDLTELRVVRLRQGDLPARMFQNGFGRLDNLPAERSMILDLGSGVSRIATQRSMEMGAGGAFAWTGDLRAAQGSAPPGIASFDVVGDRVLGYVNTGTEAYVVRPLGDGLHAIGRINPATFPPDHPSGGDEGANEDSMPFSMLQAQSTGHPTITIGIAYTEAAAAQMRAVGIDPDQYARLAVSVTNQSFEFSDVHARLDLVGSRQVAGAESGDFATDVASLVNPSDNRFDELPAWRRAIRANAVILLVAMDEYCGMASRVYAPARATYALVNQRCAVENLSFAHELGHLIGLRHDPDADANDAPFPYGHGYRLANKFRTIMATGAELRLPAWANPVKTWDGAPMGTVQRNNDARALSEMAPIFSGYFGD